MAPEEHVKELGNVLSRLLRFMQEVPPEEHILFSKIDLADGYWKMILEKESRWNFAYALPGQPFMARYSKRSVDGRNESPVYFCAATETTRDIAQTWIDEAKPLPVHVMETLRTPNQESRCQTSHGS
jgi:hypothetical protein